MGTEIDSSWENQRLIEDLELLRIQKGERAVGEASPLDQLVSGVNMGWISVEAAVPNECTDVLCFFVARGAAQQKVMCINADGEWQGEDDYHPRGENVTHWMPLPEAPNVCAAEIHRLTDKNDQLREVLKAVLYAFDNDTATAAQLRKVYATNIAKAQALLTPNVEHNRRTAASSPGVRVDGPVGPREEE